ncbi:MAG: PAS domain S-box protein [Planctomycetes bacterium]|nr:PAS domain S-box protein [Planctomycetota bacterium]
MRIRLCGLFSARARLLLAAGLLAAFSLAPGAERLREAPAIVLRAFEWACRALLLGGAAVLVWRGRGLAPRSAVLAAARKAAPSGGPVQAATLGRADEQSAPAGALGGTTTAVLAELEARRADIETLEKREANTRALLNLVSDAVVMIDETGVITDANFAVSLFGHAAGDLIGRNVSELMPPRFRERHRAGLARYVATGVSRLVGREIEVEGTRPDGQVFPVSLRLCKLNVAGTRGVVGILRDATQSRRDEESRRLSQARFRGLFGANILGILLADLSGSIADANAVLLELLGYSREELEQGRIRWEFLTAANQRPLADRAFEELRRTGACRPWETVLLRKDGRELPVLMGAAMLPGVGEECIAFVLDMTERKRAEEALRVKTDHLESVTQALGVALQSGDWGEASAVLLHHALRLTGSPSGFLGTRGDDGSLRVPAQHRFPWRGLLGRDRVEAAECGRQAKGEFVLDASACAALGEIVAGRAVASDHPATDGRFSREPGMDDSLHSFLGVPVRSGSGVAGLLAVADRPEGYAGAEGAVLEVLAQAAGLIFDRYQRGEREAALEAQLRQSQKMESLGLLAGGIVHDFNNLLSAIIGLSDLMTLKLEPTSPVMSYAVQVRKAGESAAELTRQLLAFSRKQVLQPQILDLAEVVRGMEALLRRTIGEHIDLRLRGGVGLGFVKADRGQIEQVVLNLVVNARDAMSSGGTLTIDTANLECVRSREGPRDGTASKELVCLSVSDTGCGMSESVKARLFEPFFTTKELGRGTGLGLATVYGIVKQSGGTIAVESEPERGTTIRVCLDRADEGAPRDTPAGRKGLPRGSETILVVDDSPSVRFFVVEVLKGSGYAVLAHGTPEDALAAAREHAGPIHLLVTDIVMPSLCGGELSKRFGELRPEAAVLFMSGYAEGAMLEGCDLRGGQAFLRKPLLPSALAERVRTILDARGRQCETPA